MAITRSAALALMAALCSSGCTAPKGDEPSAGRNYSVWSGVYSGIAHRETRFPRNFMRAASVIESDFTNAEFLLLSTFETRIENSKFNGVNFRGALFRSTVVRDTRLDRANFSGATLQEVSFSGSSLVDANFKEALLLFVSFENADLSGATFDGASVSGCEFPGAKFDSKSRLPFSAEEAARRGMLRMNL